MKISVSGLMVITNNTTSGPDLGSLSYQMETRAMNLTEGVQGGPGSQDAFSTNKRELELASKEFNKNRYLNGNLATKKKKRQEKRFIIAE